MPRVLSRKYTHGYVNIVCETLSLRDSSLLVAAGTVACYNAGGDTQVNYWVVAELGSILNIKKVFLATLRSKFDESIALALDRSTSRPGAPRRDRSD